MLPYLITTGCTLLCEIIIYAICNIVLPEKGMPLRSVFIRRFFSMFYALASNSTKNKPDFIVSVGVIWFLNALFLGGILLHFILKNKNKAVQITSIVLLVVLACVQTEFVCIPFGLNYACAFAAWLYTGFQINETQILKKTDEEKYRFVKILAGLLWIGIIIIEYFTKRSFNIIYLSFPLYGLEIAGAVFGSYTIRNISKSIDNIKIIKRVFSKLGRNTIWVLCVHTIDIVLWNFISGFIPVSNMVIAFIRITADILFAYLIKHIRCSAKSKIRRTNI